MTTKEICRKWDLSRSEAIRLKAKADEFMLNLAGEDMDSKNRRAMMIGDIKKARRPKVENKPFGPRGPNMRQLTPEAALIADDLRRMLNVR